MGGFWENEENGKSVELKKEDPEIMINGVSDSVSDNSLGLLYFFKITYIRICLVGRSVRIIMYNLL